MAESAVAFLLNKLALILQQEETLLTGFRDEMVWTKDELGRMKAFLRVADSMEDEDEELRMWVKQVREAANDAEDVIDEYNLRLQHRKGGGILSSFRKASSSVKNLKTRHEVAIAIKSIKYRIENISAGFWRYRFKLDGGASSSSFTENSDCQDRRGDALLIDESELVGIEEPKRQLVEWLLEGESRMNVVSVHGMGGLGKTTLIKKVYDDVQVKNHFQSHAWINVSQTFKLEELLKDIVQQLFKEMKQPAPGGMESMNCHQLKAEINEFLKERRYVLVLDDVWRISDWEGFRYALPNYNSGSKVILTTRVAEVAFRSSNDSHGRVYNLKPLSSNESWVLFCTKTFPTNSCPPHLIGLSKNILKICQGLPLAIVAISGVLSTKDSSKLDEWEKIRRSLGDELERNDGFKSTTKILSLGINDLPYYLKSCFLYLSIFPEDYLIERQRLIWLWMAEGFIEKKQGKTQEEVADDYFNELVNRSLIQVANKNVDGMVKTCRVHDLIREIILSKSKDQIFVASNELNSRWPERIRCISIHNSITNVQRTQENLNESGVSRLRSLLTFGLEGSLTSLSMASFSGMNLKLLNVLDFTGAPLEIFPEEIVQLINLRYLSLKDTKVRSLPNSIGKLRNLETLNLQGSYITQLPVQILKLRRLRHLLLFHFTEPPFHPFPFAYGFKAPSGIGELLSLQELVCIEANPCSGSLVKEIRSLTQLKRLGISKLKKEDGEILCSSIGKLRNLRSLSLKSIQEDEIIDVQNLSSPPQYLRSLQLFGRLEKFPHWIPSAHSLVTVDFYWSRLKEDPLESLGDLPNLVDLRLVGAYDGETLCFKSGGFQKLEMLKLDKLEELRTVRVEVGSMPKLERLFIWRCYLLESLPSGIASLPKLNWLQFRDMPDKLTSTLRLPNKEGGANCLISHISKVEILRSR